MESLTDGRKATERRQGVREQEETDEERAEEAGLIKLARAAKEKAAELAKAAKA